METLSAISDAAPAGLRAVCSVCGSLLAGSGACVPCLLRGGFDDADELIRFGDFEIQRQENGSLAELGRGATGVTYRARDTVLQRTVALKVIDIAAAGAAADAVRERFLREARAAAALRHPNVAEVFQFGAADERGSCYCAMELVEGETVEARVRRDGPMAAGQALDLAVQVSRALMAAAERGLVHRDLKPGNIMLTPAGQVKVIDFGLAKASTAGAGEMELTHGSFVGTPAFASPEQFSGGTVDSRSDVYALGATLWFALTGQLPFAGSTIDEVRASQQHQRLPVEQLRTRAVSQLLIRLVCACLALDPAKRPAPGELLLALESCRRRPAARGRLVAAVAAALLLAGAAAFFLVPPGDPAAPAAEPLPKSIAVLPFENLSSDAADAFLAQGLREDLSTSIGKIKELKVIARTSVMEFGSGAGVADAQEIGRRLGVSHLLTGSVRRAGDRVAVNVSLLDAREERQLWSERYERTLGDALSLQADLAREIARELQANLDPHPHGAPQKPTDNAEAYLLYLRAREIEAAQSDNSETFRDAFQLYRSAVELDPQFALARARLSMVANNIGYSHSDEQMRVTARTEADEALRQRPDLGEAWLAQSACSLWIDRDYDTALDHLKRAAELLPNSAEVPMLAAFVYKRQLRYRDRIVALRRAEELDPLNRTVSSALLLTLRWVRDWPAAVRAGDKRAVLGVSSPHLASRWTRAFDEFRLTGNIAVLKQGLAQDERLQQRNLMHLLLFARHDIAMLERDYAAAARALSEIPADGFTGTLGVFSVHRKPMREALLAVASGSDARAALDRAEADAVAEVERWRGAGWGAARALMELALIEAFRGNKEAALAHIARVRDEDAVEGSVEKNAVTSAIALVYARIGERDQAIELIEQLLTRPCEVHGSAVYNMTLTELKWRWVWDPLRDHPRFQRIVSGPEPATIY